jgi:hypothetical protein
LPDTLSPSCSDTPVSMDQANRRLSSDSSLPPSMLTRTVTTEASPTVRRRAHEVIPLIMTIHHCALLNEFVTPQQTRARTLKLQ